MPAQKLTTAQRMQFFSALTRKHTHTLPSHTTNLEHDTIEILLPKTRVLAKTYLMFEVDATIAHASEGEFTPLQPYDLLKIIPRINMDVNVGFMPVTLSAVELAMFNTIATHPDKIIGGGNRLISTDKLTASSAGTKNTYKFVLEIKNTLNDNMLQGLIMLQNQSTSVTIRVDVGKISDILGGQAGYTATLNSVKVTPAITTFTIPVDDRAQPDISILKIMHSKTETFASGGDKTVYIECGHIYRKLIWYFEDTDGLPLTPDKFEGKMELRINTAGTPYSIPAELLQYMNIDEFGQKLPDGMYVFDFSSQSPLIGFGGNRDYIDTGKVTEFTFNFNTPNACKATLISERIARLTV